MKAHLVLSNGAVFPGRLRGARQSASGEVIFNTSLTGYQEILTDPSYKGQMVVMTYPHIGNYGTNPGDVESRRPFAQAMVVRELCGAASNWQSTEDLDGYLARHGVTVLEGVDTRALVLTLRSTGSLPGLIAAETEAPLEELKRRAAKLPTMEGQNLAKEVSTQEAYPWSSVEQDPTAPPVRWKVVAYDFGIKYGILRMMARQGIEVEVVPHNTSAQEVLARKPHGVFLSNGPGDPEPVTEAIQAVKDLAGKVPLFGICLGHQILALALGGKTYKLKFGHHGANHPVQDLSTGRIEITSQNHGFAVDSHALGQTLEVTHINLNDKTVEGIRSTIHPAFSVQYHPEASPGPHDSAYLFQRFVQMMEEFHQPRAGRKIS
ncbi:MAG: glutamine-hydrolyzing carbamoyl-phosphate synthase small subunit [Deltaproteobacteria bacterium]|nr:glutamine-hydrolyzing carbamoyl-phosphate synthase small subunit [Deltaproteobacteria bacterium]